MKLVLALATLVLAALVVEERARQVARDAQSAYGEAVHQAHDATETLTENVEQRPFLSLALALGLGYVLAKLIPRR